MMLQKIAVEEDKVKTGTNFCTLRVLQDTIELHRNFVGGSNCCIDTRRGNHYRRAEGDVGRKGVFGECCGTRPDDAGTEWMR